MDPQYNLEKFAGLAKELAQTGRKIYAKGWSPATSSNYSVRIDTHSCAITVSGKDKGSLTENDIMPVNLSGHALNNKQPSAETLLHTSLYQQFNDIGAVLHTHSIAATVLTMLQLDKNKVVLSGYELLKAFPGIKTHESTVIIPVFENTQDIASLSQEVKAFMHSKGRGVAYLIRGHGLYTWGETLSDCERHLEALEFLLTCELEKLKIGRLP